jgi:hypothetical protein
MITQSIGAASRWLLVKIVDAVAATGINPNVLTFFGMLVNFWAAVMFAAGMFGSAASLIFLAGFLDMLDGQVARRGKNDCIRRVPSIHARLFGYSLVHGFAHLLRRAWARPTSSWPPLPPPGR